MVGRTYAPSGMDDGYFRVTSIPHFVKLHARFFESMHDSWQYGLAVLGALNMRRSVSDEFSHEDGR